MNFNKFIFLLIFSLIKSKEAISQNYIDENFKEISKKENLEESLLTVINNGDYEILKYYLQKLKENKINYDLSFSY